jgi:hypothetical protein
MIMPRLIQINSAQISSRPMDDPRELREPRRLVRSGLRQIRVPSGFAQDNHKMQVGLDLSDTFPASQASYNREPGRQSRKIARSFR